MSDTTIREIAADLRKPIPPLEPTAVTFPSTLASISGEVEEACRILSVQEPNVSRMATDPVFRETLVNTADALRHIAEPAAGALGALARAGVKPSPLSPVVQESRS